MFRSNTQTLAQATDEKMSRPTVPRFRYVEYGIRAVFIATTTSLLGVTGYIAGRWGSEHMEKVYAVAISGVRFHAASSLADKTC